MLKKASLYAVALAFLCASAYAQLWPLPSYTTPDTPEPCALCQGSAVNMPTPGWHDPVIAYVGRFVSSEYVPDFQQVYRTARAGGIVFNPDGSRFAVKLGQGVATYSTADFFTAMANHNPMTSVSTLGVTGCQRALGSCDGLLETFLQFDKYFYAENSATAWLIAYTDGQDRLGVFDYDDRGLLYIGYEQYGWGIATEGSIVSGRLMSSWQDKNAFNTFAPIIAAFWVKDGSSYYALAYSSYTSTVTHVFSVPAYNSATEVRTIATPIKALARLGSKSVVLTTSRYAPPMLFDNHALVTGGAGTPIVLPSGAAPSQVVSDGTYAWVSYYLGGTMNLSRISPDGSHTEFTSSYGTPNSMTYGSGYITLVTLDGTGSNIHIYKVTSGTPVEQPQPTSVSAYYRAQANYAPMPPHMSLQSANTLVYNGKLYLFVNADGIGDVYQLRTDDMVVVGVNGTNGPWNPNAPAKAPTDIFYGDTVKMNATLSSNAAGGALTWNFGAPHDPANTQPGTFGSPITHQYTGLSKTDVVSPVTVTVTNSANGVTGNSQVTLKTGTARVMYGPAGTPKYFTSSNKPILMDDSFFDASDGDTTGHYTEWRVGPDAATITAPAFTPQYTDPLTAVSVGGCGQHTLSMTAHYGYSTNSPNNVDFPVSLPSLFTYNAVTFAPGVDVSYNASTGKEQFVSTSRAAAALAGRTFSYTWDVLDSTGTAVTSIPSQSGTTTSIDTIPGYAVAKDAFPAGGKGRLTLSVSGVDPCSQTGGTMPAQSATSSALVAPDAVLTANVNNGVATYTVSSPSNVMTTDAWTFAWTATGGSPASGTGSSLTTTYSAAGSYPVSVTVTNKTGLTKTLTYTATVTVVILCPTFNPLNTGIVYAGSTCTAPNPCQAGDQIQFSVGYVQQPDTNCQTILHYAWTVDNAAAGSTATMTRSFSTAGQHTVGLTLTAGTPPQQTFNTSLPVTIGSIIQPPQPQPQPTCGTVTSQAVTISYSGTSASCNNGAGNTGTCGANENISFHGSVYAFQPGTCSITYTWSFDGAAGGTGSDVTHAFATSGPHTIGLTVSSSNGTSGTTTATVNVGTPQTGGSCPTLNPNQNVFLNYSGDKSGCSSANETQCQAADHIAFSVGYWNYNKGCGTHHYTWKVDGSQVGTDDDNTTVTLTGGTHTVSVTIDNGNTPTTTMTDTLTIGIPVTANYTFDFNIVPLSFPAYSYAFTVSVTPDTPSKPTQWQWNFGDGSQTVTAGAIQTHTFPDDKEYTVTVTATDGTGGIVSHTIQSPPAKHRGARH